MSVVKKTLTVNNTEVEFSDERNLLEVIRKAGIDIPTFCYHSELSIYGACRLCLVDIKGRGIMASCSIKPEPGMVVQTDTKAIRNMRKINVELLLASHNRECPTCQRSANCTLQDLARKLGVKDVRYKQTQKNLPLDTSSPSLVRDPNKCVLCGDCVRVCSEVQSVGALDFASRGSNARVVPAFDNDLSEGECVNCGQCAQVCPTGAIVAKSDADKVWEAIYDPEKVVVVQVAPAVRVGLGERFGFKTGENVARKMVTAMKMMGFDHVYDTCFAADMTIFEEATEFIERLTTGGKLPMFTSCCPAWVEAAKRHIPDIVPMVSSTPSPMGYAGQLAREKYPDALTVFIGPCIAKRREAQNDPNTDFVMTFEELGALFAAREIDLISLEGEQLERPASVFARNFAHSCGVSEAILEQMGHDNPDANLPKIDGKFINGLDRKSVNLLKMYAKGKLPGNFVEVMACSGGCVGGPCSLAR